MHPKFNSGLQLYNFLNNYVDKGTKKVFALAYTQPPPEQGGHVVVLRAWKEQGGTLSTRTIDFQLEPGDPNRFSRDWLPNGDSYLIYSADGPEQFAQGDYPNKKRRVKRNANDDGGFIRLSQLIKSKNATLYNQFVSGPISPSNNTVPSAMTIFNKLNSKSLPSALSCNKRIVGYFQLNGNQYFSAFHAQRLTHVITAFMPINDQGSVLDHVM